MRMCGINQVHGGFTHEHTHRVYILHTHNTHTQRAIQTLKPCQWRLKAFRKVFDLSISIVCFIAHIFYAVYAQNSVRSLAHVLVTIAHKVENSLEPNISESLHVCWWVCLWPVARGPWSCGVASSSARLLALFGKNRIAAHYARWNSRLEAILTVRRVRTQPQKKCAMFALYLEAVLWAVALWAWQVEAHTMLDEAILQTSAWHCPCKS